LSIRIPDSLANFLERATVGIGGTRDADRGPHVHRLSGWSVRDDRNALTCLVAPQFAPDLLSSLNDNGEFALTISEIPSHETYQLKGSSLGVRGVEEADIAVCDRHRARFTARVGELFRFPEPALRSYVPEPSLAFDLAVREVFVQTPGPEAGKRLLPESD